MNHDFELFFVVTGITLLLWGCASTIQSQSKEVSANRDAVVADILRLGADAYQFKIRPASMGGGNGAYDGSTGGAAYGFFRVDGPSSNNANATYAITARTATSIQFTGTSKTVTASIVAITFDANGMATTPVYTGQFK